MRTAMTKGSAPHLGSLGSADCPRLCLWRIAALVRGLTAAHRQFAKSRGVQRIGRYNEGLGPPPVGACDGQDEQPLRPLCGADDTPLEQRSSGAVIPCNTLGRQFEQRRLPAFIADERQTERGERGGRQPNRVDGAQMHCRGEMNGRRANEGKTKRGEAHQERAPQRNAPRRTSFAIKDGSLRQ